MQRERNGINHTVSPLGRAGWEQMRSSWAQTGKATKLCPPAEDLEDLERKRSLDGGETSWSAKTFKSGEEKAGSIDNIGDSRYLAAGRLS